MGKRGKTTRLTSPRSCCGNVWNPSLSVYVRVSAECARARGSAADPVSGARGGAGIKMPCVPAGVNADERSGTLLLLAEASVR